VTLRCNSALAGIAVAIALLTATQASALDENSFRNAPETKRREMISAWFDPKPGDPVAVDAIALRDFPRGGNVLKLRGFIKVTPPRNTCITITRRAELRDVRVCKPMTVEFTVEDLHEDGSLWWEATVGRNDFGTRLSWPSPHRVAWAIPAEAKLPAEPELIIIESCTIGPPVGSDRRIHLRPFDRKRWGDLWIVNLPWPDRMMEQPAKAPNLFVTKEAKTEIVSERKTAEAKDPPKGDSGNADPAKTAVVEPEREPNEYKLPWKVGQRDTYIMNSENFMHAGPLPPGMQGQCRYQFVPSRESPSGGRIECHGADQFAWIYVPLACIGQLSPAPQTNQ